MLLHTFCHIPGIGTITERKLWDTGTLHWDDVLRERELPLTGPKSENLRAGIKESKYEYDKGNLKYFRDLLPSSEIWRMLGVRQGGLLFLDIETTGVFQDDTITTIATWDGSTLRNYTNQNFGAFKRDVQNYEILITFNGQTFDLPILRSFLHIRLDQIHIDLRYLLKSLGYQGGLKSIEKAFGIDRGQLDGVDGYTAVLLWREYQKSRNQAALDTLMFYNSLDVLNLHILLERSVAMKLESTPFRGEQLVADYVEPKLNFSVDLELLQRINSQQNPMPGFW